MALPIMDIAIALNIIVDIIMRFKEYGINITAENIIEHIAKLEQKANENDKILGIDNEINKQ